MVVIAKGLAIVEDPKPSVVQALHLMNSTKLQTKLADEDFRSLVSVLTDRFDFIAP